MVRPIPLSRFNRSSDRNAFIQVYSRAPYLVVRCVGDQVRLPLRGYRGRRYGGNRTTSPSTENSLFRSPLSYQRHLQDPSVSMMTPSRAGLGKPARQNGCELRDQVQNTRAGRQSAAGQHSPATASPRLLHTTLTKTSAEWPSKGVF
jgi:hypothetical protein